MTKPKYPRSLAKYIRKRKAFIRRTVQNKEEQEQLIVELINRIDDVRSSKA